MKILLIVSALLCSEAFAGRLALFRSKQEIHYALFAKNWAEQGVNVFTAVDKNGDTMLHIAARTGNLVAAQYWLANGADVNALNNNRESPLYVAIDKENSKVADFFLRKGAQFTTDVETANPVIIAAYRGQTKLLRKMLKGGGDPNATDKRNLGKTPLGVSLTGYIARLLLATDGIEIDKADANGQTALHDAAGRGYLNVVEWLIASGANPNIVDNDGKTPADIAEENLLQFEKYQYSGKEYKAVIELLRSLELNFEPVH